MLLLVYMGAREGFKMFLKKLCVIPYLQLQNLSNETSNVY